MIFKTYLMNKNFLVTGASGFIASHIADYLTKKF